MSSLFTQPKISTVINPSNIEEEQSRALYSHTHCPCCDLYKRLLREQNNTQLTQKTNNQIQKKRELIPDLLDESSDSENLDMAFLSVPAIHIENETRKTNATQSSNTFAIDDAYYRNEFRKDIPSSRVGASSKSSSKKPPFR